jgi:hypothetical protein
MRLIRSLKKKPKQQPSGHQAFDFGTHVPVLKSILEVFQPTGILELGAGKVSTPLFHQCGSRLITVETNAQWVEEVRHLVPPRENFTLIHHVLNGIHERTKIGAISQRVKDECIQYYRRIVAANPDLNLLFIDHVSGLRAVTLAALYQAFDFVVYHDAEDKGYGYELFSACPTDNYFHFVLRTFVPFTGILIRRSFAGRLADFKRVLDKHARAYFDLQYRFDLLDMKTCDFLPSDIP